MLASRVADYSPALLDELTLAGEVVWAGAGSLAGSDGWIVLAPAEIAPLVLPPPDEIDDSLAVALRDALGPDEAVFFRSLADRAGGEANDDDLTRAVWELLWGGWLTNDTLGPVRTLLGAGRGAHRRKPRTPRGRYGRYATLAPAPGRVSALRPPPPAMAGRWSAAPPRDSDPTRRALAATDVLLDRYGVVTRGSVAGERIT